MFLYVLKKELLDSMGADQDMLVVHAFDAHGEEHGRSEAGFGWALKLNGAVDGTKVMNLKGLSDLQGETSLNFIPRFINSFVTNRIHWTSSGIDQLLLVSTSHSGDDRGSGNAVFRVVR